MKTRYCTGAGTLLLFSPAVYAQAGQAMGQSPSISILQVAFALFLVLGAIVLFAWLSRRLLPGQGGSHTAGGLKVVGGLHVGTRERIVVVEAGDTWLILGVSAAGISTLHAMPRPVDWDVNNKKTDASAFSDWLQKALNKSPKGTQL